VDSLLCDQEQEIALIGCVALAQRYMKTTTLDEFMGSIVLFAKTIVVAEMFFVDKRIMCWYLIAYFSTFTCGVLCGDVAHTLHPASIVLHGAASTFHR